MAGSAGKLLIIAGCILIATGVILVYFKSVPLGRLPGDIRIEKENFSIFIPVTSSILITLIISLFFFLVKK